MGVFNTCYYTNTIQYNTNDGIINMAGHWDGIFSSRFPHCVQITMCFNWILSINESIFLFHVFHCLKKTKLSCSLFPSYILNISSVYYNFYGDTFFVLQVKRWCSSALVREYLKMHSRDITPVYLPTDKQVTADPHEIHLMFFSFYC